MITVRIGAAAAEVSPYGLTSSTRLNAGDSNYATEEVGS